MTPLIPDAQRDYHDSWHFSPGVAAGGFVFLSGATGGDRRTGQMPDTLAEQAENAFGTIAEVLAEDGLTLADVVEMTTYHVGLQAHLDAFKGVKDRHISAPYPAWTAIGVTELASAGAMIEIRVIARCHEG